MQVTEIEANGLKRELKVVIPAQHLEARMGERLAEIARTIAMPGFRPGKVPVKLVRQKYGPSIMGEVLEKAVNDGTQQALTEKGLRPAVQPSIEITSFSEGTDLEIKVVVETLPEIVPMDFSTISLEREKAEMLRSRVLPCMHESGSRTAKPSDV